MRGSQEPPALSMSEQDYFQFPPPNSFLPDSPDTFFPIQVQPSVSAASEDSAITPPSPVAYSKPRLSRTSTHTQSTATPQITQPPPSSHAKSSTSAHGPSNSSRRHGHGHSSHRHSANTSHAHTSAHSHATSQPSTASRKERSRQLSNTPRDTLISLTVSAEYHSREAKSLLATALMHLDSTREKLAREQALRRGIEDEKKVQGVKTTQAMMDAQRELLDKKEEVRRFIMEIENEKSELTKARGVIQHLEAEKDELERALVRSRTQARSLKEKTVLLQAREEGRREGFEEGLRQGRARHGVVDLTLLPGGNVGVGEVKALENGSAFSKQLESEIEEEQSLRKIAEKEIHRTKVQLKHIERELDTERQRNKELNAIQRKLKGQMEEQMKALEKEWKAKFDEEVRKREQEEKERKALSKELQRERDRQLKKSQEDEIRKRRDEELRRREDEERRRREDREARSEENRWRRMEREMRELRAEKERLEKEKVDDAKEREEKEANRMTAAITAATTAAVEAANASKLKSPEYQRIPYIAMPPPPAGGPVARTGSSGSKKRSRRVSTGSASSTGSGPLEMLQTPGPSGQRLSVIQESPNRDYDDDYDEGVPTIRVEDENGDEEQAPTPTQVPMGMGWGMPAPGGFGGPAWPNPDVPQIIPNGRTGYEPGMPEPNIPQIIPSGRSGYEPGMPEPTIPQIVGPGYANRSRRHEVEMPMPNPDLLHAGGLGPGFGMQRKPSNASSTGSIEIHIEPPSRPPSSIDQPHLESRHHLSPNTPLSELPSLPSQEQALPIRPRMPHNSSSSSSGSGWGANPAPAPSPYDFDTSGYDTQPSSPVIPGVTVPMPRAPPTMHQRTSTPGPVPSVPAVPGLEDLPPGFVPQTITDRRGVSTPIWGGGVALPAAGVPTSTSSGGGRNKTPGPYGNPLNKSKDMGEEPESRSFGVAPPPPPASFGFMPSPSMGGSRPLGGGMTPSMGGTRSLAPGDGGVPFVPSSPNLGARSGVSIYGPSSAFSPGPGASSQLPSGGGAGGYNNPLRGREDEDENDDGFDHHTLQNTMMNASIGRVGTPAAGPPGGFPEPEEPAGAFGGGGSGWGDDGGGWGTIGGSANTGESAPPPAVAGKKKKGKRR